ncbi:MAG: GNAT family N-acetyltransferase [Clostridia bacterium]|nr:GNAT family N-acetyltransferase [Clostridia bacterium]
MAHMGQVIVSGRIMLRSFTKADAEEYYAVAHDSQIKRYVPYSYTETLEDAVTLLDNYANVDFVNDFYYAICNADTSQMVGAILAYRNSSFTLEVCAFVGRQFRGLGYCSQATMVFARHIADSTPYTALNFAVKRSNSASRAIMRKLGFKCTAPEYFAYVLPR